MTRANFKTWLQQTTGLAFEHGVFVVGVPSIFAREWLSQRCEPLVKRVLAKVLGHEVSVEFRVAQPGAESLVVAAAPRAEPKGLDPRYTFDTFVVGEGNRLACSAAQTAALRPGRSYNPLFLYGEPGTGKTHLLHAMGHRAHQEGFNLLCTSPEQLANDFITAIRQRATEDLRQQYRRVDLLLVDDVHFLGGKRQTQEFFFHTFNELYQASRQIVLCSDRPPESLPLDERLRSRFQWGLVADLRRPDQTTRLSILRQRAQELGICTDHQCLELLACHCQGSVRELEGCLHRVAAYAQLHQVPLSAETAQLALALFPATPGPATLTAEAVLDAVAGCFNVTVDQLRGPGRSRELGRARQVAVYVMREQLGWSLQRIGAELGGRDHSTVLYAYKRAALSQGKAPEIQAVLAALKGASGNDAQLRVVS